ncbi:MAG TPA: PLP-dependent cysteine synthase family protein [Gemmatimonadaceae bacterium]|nr:PLP-dependent cysteine synthase family protein [Gemmatimonadaceae bacterium]
MTHSPPMPATPAPHPPARADDPIATTLARVDGLARLVGNTPMLAIDFDLDGRRRTVHAKLESMNFTGSVKDRMALHILRRAYEQGLLSPGALIVEATSGNTGISFAALGRALGHPVAIFMPDWMSAERINLIQSLGAAIHLVAPDEGGFLGSIAKAEALAAATPGAFLPRQFSNADNSEAHETTTGPEIRTQLAVAGVGPDAFVAGVGTGGTIMGTGRYLRSRDPGVRLHPIEPASSPTLSTGHKVGKHRIQGISDEFVPPIVDLDALDDVIAVDDGDAIVMAQHLARTLGLAVGISSGANFLGAVIAQERLGADAAVATVFPDSNKKYLSTDLLRDEPVRADFLSRRIALREFRALPRHCDFCPPEVRARRS